MSQDVFDESRDWQENELRAYLTEVAMEVERLEEEDDGEWSLATAVRFEKLSKNLLKAKKKLAGLEGGDAAAPGRASQGTNGRELSDKEKRKEERRKAIQRKRSLLVEKEKAKADEKAAKLREQFQRDQERMREVEGKLSAQEAVIARLNEENRALRERLENGVPTMPTIMVLDEEETEKVEHRGDAYRAIADFSATSKTQLSVAQGDLVYVLEKPGSWWVAEKGSGESGLVPSNYLVKDKPATAAHATPSVIASAVSPLDLGSVASPQLREKRGGAQSERMKRASQQFTQLTSDVIKEVKTWEDRKTEFQTTMESVVKSHQHKLTRVCAEFLTRYDAALRAAGTSGEEEEEHSQHRTSQHEFHRELAKEKERIATLAEAMFNEADIITPVTTLISSMQRQVSGVDHSLVLAQAQIRGFLARKKWCPILKKMKARSHVARELEHTEKQYMSSMHVVLDVFRAKLEKEREKQSLISSPPCSKADIATMFAHIDSIIQVNHELEKSLTLRMQDWSNNQVLGDIFHELTPYLKVYIQYVNNYDSAQAVLEKNMKKPSFANILDKCKRDPRARGLDIQSYLIMPVQRVPRYSLLLRDLLKKTPTWHRDYDALKKGLMAVSKVAETINEAKREEENKRKVRSISELLGHKCEDLVQPQRRFVHQGALVTDSLYLCAPAEKEVTEPYEVHFFVFNDLLVLTTKPAHEAITTTIMKSVLGNDQEVYKVREKIEMDQIVVKEVAREDEAAMFSFTIQYKNRVPDQFYCHTYAELIEWLRIFADAVQMLEFKRSTLRLTEESFDPFSVGSQRRSRVGDLEADAAADLDDDVLLEGSVPDFANTPKRPTSAQRKAQRLSQFDVENQELLAGMGRSPIKEILPYLTEALWLYKELFQVPIELQTFIPEYCSKLPPGYLKEINSRLQLLKRRLGDLGNVRDRITLTIQSEKVSADLNTSILAGKSHLFDVFVWVQQSFPPNGPNQRPRELLNALIQWYNSLCQAWQQVLDEPAS